MSTNPPKKQQDLELELEDQIRQRAYELYQECGSEDGHELDDWLRAEDEITAA